METNPANQPSVGPTRRAIMLGAFVAFLLAFLGFFHIVQSRDNMMLIAKEHFSYALTFTSIEEVLRRNNDSFHKDPLLEHLVQELGQRGKIHGSSQTADPATERELARIWKQTQDQGVELDPSAKDIVRKYYPDSR